jgi:diketogulonate reductase-like aldo/keto reductase
MELTIASTVTLNNGVEMPRLGLGVYQVPDGDPTERAVAAARATGYPPNDTPQQYRNEASVGRAVRASGIDRADVWVTTKLWPSDFLRVRGAFDASLGRLGLDYVDLYLVHFPVPGTIGSVWRQMEAIADSGLARAVGVSNFSSRQLGALLRTARIPPAVNQVRASVFGYRHAVYDVCQREQVAFEAYSPLRRGRLDDPTVAAIAQRYGRTPAQVVLRWGLQKGMVVIPKSARAERIAENAALYDFSISDSDLEALDALSR